MQTLDLIENSKVSFDEDRVDVFDDKASRVMEKSRRQFSRAAFEFTCEGEVSCSPVFEHSLSLHQSAGIER